MKKNLSFSRILESDELRNELFVLLRSVGVFAEMNQEELLEILSVMEHVLYDPGELIFPEKSTDSNLHLILNGEVFLTVEKLGGSQEILARLGRRSAFGEIAFITGAPRTAAARSGPAGSEHLILGTEAFSNFLAHHPEITFKTMSGIISDIGQRTDFLPPDLANYAVWGYMRQRTAAEVEKLQPRVMKRGFVIVGLGLLGVILGWLMVSDLSERIPVTVEEIDYFTPMAVSATTFMALVLGFFFGSSWDTLESETARNQRHDRCCLNCKFVQWDETDLSFSCAYTEMELSHTKIELGEEFDTFTACPSFSYKGTTKVKMKARDGLKDGIN